jgi:hypothetical protein
LSSFQAISHAREEGLPADVMVLTEVRTAFREKKDSTWFVRLHLGCPKLGA